MPTSSNNKPIGRMIDPALPNPHKGVQPAVVIAIVLAVGTVSFLAGTRLDDYSSLSGALSGGTTENQELPNDLDYSSVERVYDKLRREYDGNLTLDGVLDGLKQGLAESTSDPYTTYLNKEQAEQFNSDLNGTFSGIGAEIGKDGEFLTVVSPLKGFPADLAGLHPGDIIFKIDDTDTVGYSIEEAVLAIRGETGTEVVLTILREGEQIDFAITRATITVPSVEYEVKDGIGVMSVYRFSEDTVGLVRKAAAEFNSKKVKGVVLDLRGNSGGFLNSAVDVSSLWLDSKIAVEQREDNGKKVTQSYKTGADSPLKGIKTVVLINKGSASASEIVAGALQDFGAATLIGETSYGKGSVQALEQLSDGGVLKVTVARWYTPKGNNIDKEGVEPDTVVVFDRETKVDEQMVAALKFLNK